MLLKSLALLAASAAMITGATTMSVNNDETQDKVMVKLADAPGAVKKSLAEHQPGVEFKELEFEKENGAKLYKGVWKKGDVESEIAVDEAGSLVEIETKMTVKTVPAAVAAAAKKAFPKGELVFEKKTMVFYEVEVMIDGKEHELLLSPSGQAMQIENEAMEENGDEDGDDDEEVEDDDDDDDKDGDDDDDDDDDDDKDEDK